MTKPVYLPKPRRSMFWIALAEFSTLVALYGSIIALAVFARALMGV